MARCVLNSPGEIVKEEWFKTRIMRSDVEVLEDEFVIMPNHLHGIIWLFDSCLGMKLDRRGRVDLQNSSKESALNGRGTGDLQVARTRPMGPPSGSIGAMIAGFKSAATKRINILRGTPSAPVWHRNYYDNIISTEKEYENIVNYMAANPENWGGRDEYFT